ncbi:MAG TPA: tetratricopeptide repeat protein [Isosphaeraceae bacterium]|nr:tetratricopeptide repeat protein [Isosphaeraceae bacterium]
MKVWDWQDLVLDNGILRESMSDGSRLVLWVPGARDGTFQYWERVGIAARAEVTVAEGLCATAATSIPVRQRLGGLFGKLLGRLREAKGSRDFVLPGGGSAEQCGERAADLMLVWAEDSNAVLEADRIQARWPEGGRHQRLGPNLYLVGGLQTQATSPAAAAAPPVPSPEVSPRKNAEDILAAARQAGDRPNEASALTDLGIILLSEGDPRGSITVLEQALTLTRQLGDRARENDVLGNLGLALLHIQQPSRARELFEHVLAYARSTGDRLAEKLALERLGLATASLGDPARALAFFEQALAMARQVGDRQQEANLLWLQGIQHAELGQREPATAKAQEAIALFAKQGKPQAGWYGAYLQKYRMGLFDTGPEPQSQGVTTGPNAATQAYLGGSLVASVVAGQAQAGRGAAPGKAATGPGLLRMALSATKAMAQFAGSGFQMSPPEVQQKRLQTCAACEHHTGLRCKICGCFTGAKSRILHESCPIGKWPA